jgi:hypothetical protein
MDQPQRFPWRMRFMPLSLSLDAAQKLPKGEGNTGSGSTVSDIPGCRSDIQSMQVHGLPVKYTAALQNRIHSQDVRLFPSVLFFL